MKTKATQECDLMIREIFEGLTFVGAIDPKRSLIQYDTKLYLCNTQTLSENLFHQILIFDFQNLKSITLTNPLSIRELALLALTEEISGWTEKDGSKDDLAESVKSILVEKRLLMKEYFSLVINADGYLEKLPLLLCECPKRYIEYYQFLMQFFSNSESFSMHERTSTLYLEVSN